MPFLFPLAQHRRRHGNSDARQYGRHLSHWKRPGRLPFCRRAFSVLETYDIYLRCRLMSYFGKLWLNAINHARVSVGFDATSEDKPAAANRAFDILRAMLASVCEWGDIDEHVPDACANIVKNPRLPVARFLEHTELKHLCAVLDRCQDDNPWPVAAIRLLILTGARLSEIINLKWDEISELTQEGACARLEDSKTGSRTVWLGPEATNIIKDLPKSMGALRVFPDSLTPNRVYAFWSSIWSEAGLP